MSTADLPKVSVLIPSYNHARFLPEAIASVLAQDFRDFELLLSDDASTDGSAAIIREFAARDSRIRFQIHPRNLGMVPHWNWCLQEARGDYIKFVFGDDGLASGRTLGVMATMLDAEPSAVLAATARLLLDENSQPEGVWNSLGPAGFHRGAVVISQCLRRDRNLIGEPSAVMFRRAFASRGFDPQLRQLVDEEMWLHLLRQGDLVYDPRPLCVFRRHPSQQTVVNLRPHIGPEDSLLITARYLDCLAPARVAGLSLFGRRRILYRHLHYARKHSCRSPAIRRAEAVLLAQLPLAWYVICWFCHRASKPAINLARTYCRYAGARVQSRPVADVDLAGPAGPQ
jgi:glycosyltransferase involved in cell wall biosynthesis